jgi:hypothetical protein
MWPLPKNLNRNTEYIPGNFDPDKPSNYLLYLDANNLYGHVMSQILPTGNLTWVHAEHLPDPHKMKLGSTSKTGYALEVDLYLPREHHDKLKDFPPLCEKTVIPVEELSPFDPKCNRNSDNQVTANTQKLVNHLAPVKN